MGEWERDGEEGTRRAAGTTPTQANAHLTTKFYTFDQGKVEGVLVIPMREFRAIAFGSAVFCNPIFIHFVVIIHGNPLNEIFISYIL